MKRHPETKKILAVMERWAKRKKWTREFYQKNILHLEQELGVQYRCRCLSCRLERLEDYTQHGRHYTFYFSIGRVLVGLEKVDSVFTNYIDGEVVHFIPTSCKNLATFAYCARPNTGKVIKHKIGNCPLAREAKE